VSDTEEVAGVRRIRKPRPKPHTNGKGGALPKRSVRAFKLGQGFDLNDMRKELDDYVAVLLGRIDPPIDNGVSTLMEVSEAFHARAREMEMMLWRAETDGTILKGSKHARFRTTELRSFLELTKRTIEVGNRLITLELEQNRP
jgi:hypothetical protein